VVGDWGGRGRGWPRDQRMVPKIKLCMIPIKIFVLEYYLKICVWIFASTPPI
jgi:hypothetical protein